MKKTTKIIIASVFVVVIAAGAIVLSRDKTANEGQDNTTANGQTQTILYKDSGFSPAEVTVASGSSVTVVNQSESEIEPSSDPHPVHTNNPELNFGDIEPGKSKTVTLTAKGTWGYHNHYKPDNHATITVE